MQKNHPFINASKKYENGKQATQAGKCKQRAAPHHPSPSNRKQNHNNEDDDNDKPAQGNNAGSEKEARIKGR